jgi:hypothetical protein
MYKCDPSTGCHPDLTVVVKIVWSLVFGEGLVMYICYLRTLDLNKKANINGEF